jgi:hypothetical protein
MFNPTDELALFEDHKRRLMREARMHQLYRQAEMERGMLSARLMHLLGELMVSGGEKLMARGGETYPAAPTPQNS